ncbi:hypothetical protein BOKEGFJH_00933 [Chlamydia avium]|uniref:Inclusion membrane protein n=1 Tax=Chlamydia avium TaxID=1457141 RepID=A0ABN0MTJ1_9CHLA|nr:hypothetical protein [Chlamydia avium]EPP38758.1 hypothetical protein CP10881SC42_0391 [Chlamydia avium]VVT43385.1 hypothetical protein BOKEGFJH_00933 [Chlamydia avium]
MTANLIAEPLGTSGLENKFSLSLFSDLTPEERGEVTSLWKSRCPLVSCIVGLVLSIFAISVGLLVLTLLPATTLTFIGVAFVAIGTVLLITSISLYLSIRLPKRSIPPRVSVRDLQNQLRAMLTAHSPCGEVRREDLLATIQKKEEMLATFDRELRKQERFFYSLLSQETENRHQILLDLSEFRELQERVSSELGSLYSYYGGHSVGSTNDFRLLQLESERNLLIQQIMDLEASKSSTMKFIEEHREKLKTLSQEVHQVELQIVEEESSELSESKSKTFCVFQNLLQERNNLLNKLAEGYNELISSSMHQERLMQQRLNLDMAIQDILNSENLDVLLKRDYKERYLQAKITIQCLREQLRNKESKVFSLSHDVDLLNETIEQLKESSPLNAAIIEELHALRQEVSSKKEVISDMQEQITINKSLIKEFTDINTHLSDRIQQHEKDQLLIGSLEQQQNILEAKVNEQREQLDRKVQQIHSLKEENEQLRDTMFSWESGQVRGLMESLAKTQKQMQVLQDEKSELADSLHLSRMSIENTQEKIEKLIKEVTSKDEELLRSKGEITKLQDLLATSEEEAIALRDAVLDKENLLSSYQSLQSLVSQLESDRIVLEEKMRNVVEQNLAATESARESGEEKVRLVQEIQALRQRYTREVEDLNKDKAKLEEEMLQRHFSYTREVSHLQSVNRQMEIQLKEARTLAEHSEDGALQMLASQLITLSPYVKDGCKKEIINSSFDRVLAFASPRFFGYLGSKISCDTLRPGVYLEEEGWASSEEDKQSIVRRRCFREWLFALLGHFVFNDLQLLVKRAREFVQESPVEDKSSLFIELEKEFPLLGLAEKTLNDWILQCYPYISALPIFNSPERWKALLFELLQEMYEGPQGAFGSLLPQERNYFEVLSHFAGSLPLVLGSIGCGDGTLPESSRPLLNLTYTTFGNASWGRVEKAVQQLLHIRSFLSGPLVLDVGSVSEAVLRTTSLKAYTAMLSQRFSSSKWSAPKDM